MPPLSDKLPDGHQAPARKRFRRVDWLQLGMVQVVALGREGLSVERLCAAGKRTRGSFYHHFVDHDTFIEALAEYWQHQQTEQIIEAVDAQDSPQQRVQALQTLAAQLDHRLDGAMRRLATTHAVVNKAVKAVDARRIAYLCALDQAANGSSPAQAMELAQLEYAVFVGAQTLWPDEPPLSLLTTRTFRLVMER